MAQAKKANQAVEWFYANPAPHIVSGTFWFDAVNTAGETIQIRSGRFDMNY